MTRSLKIRRTFKRVSAGLALAAFALCLAALSGCKSESARADEDVTMGNPQMPREMLILMRACLSCHTIDGTIKSASSFRGLYGSKIEMQNGTSEFVNEEFIREAILSPNAKIRKDQGSNSPMPSYQGQYKPEEIEKIVHYIKSLGDQNASPTN